MDASFVQIPKLLLLFLRIYIFKSFRVNISSASRKLRRRIEPKYAVASRLLFNLGTVEHLFLKYQKLVAMRR